MVKLHVIKWSQIAFLSLFLTSSLPSFCADDEEEFFHGESVRVLESAYKLAPTKVHFIVDSLTNKEGLMRYKRNYAIFNGEPGVGKSVLALAVAYKLKWDIQQFGANDFMQVENRNGTAVIFNKIMSQFEDYDANTVIIIDEINRLLMNYDSKHHDTDESSTGLWLFLDHIRHKSNLFCIGTTNGIGGFPPQLRSRFRACIVTVEAPKDFDIVKDIFFENLARENIKLSAEGLQYIHDHFYKLKNYNARDILSLVEELKYQYVKKSPELYQKGILCIEPEHLDETFKEFSDLDLQFNVKPYHEVEFEQRERHHQEILNQNKLYQEVALKQNREQFWISIAVNVFGIGLSLYFNNLNCAKALAAQLVMHKDSLKLQEDLHSDGLVHQQFLHQESMRQQEIFHHQIIQNQQAVHIDALAQQKILQKEALRQQEKLHAEALDAQNWAQMKDFAFRAFTSPSDT